MLTCQTCGGSVTLIRGTVAGTDREVWTPVHWSYGDPGEDAVFIGWHRPDVPEDD